ncbi:hypothetical protein GCM10027449_00500 [Sinomonas notoginsengisoli]|uniref:hypothetical protein n=1 Tax=Sinomonas notoginsengisoli TaxID=1457311 RepID=UPI001F40A767|nr:hypothetical protein [Sinomonas notoginsengisoli]
MSSRQTLHLPDTQPQPAAGTQAPHAPSSAESGTARPRPSEEVTTMAQRIRHVLSAIGSTRIDTLRIDAQRAAVERELGLSRPLL